VRKRRVWPVAGRYLAGVPHVPHDCDDPACTESGAFITDPPAEPVETQPEGEAPADPADKED